MPSDYIVRQTEPELWTVGTVYTDQGREKFDPASDHASEEEAAAVADRLNGGTVARGLAAAAIGDVEAYTGPDGEHVEVTPEHLAAVARVLPGVHVAIGHQVAQLIADAEARGARAGYNDGARDGYADAMIGAVTPEHQADLRAAWQSMPYAEGLRPWDGPSALVVASEKLRDRLAAVLVRDAEQLAELHRHRESLAVLVDEPERDPGTVVLTVEQWQAEIRRAAAKGWDEGHTAGGVDTYHATERQHGRTVPDDAPEDGTPNPYAD